MFHRVAGHSGASAKDKKHIERIRAALDFEELCAIWGYEVEDHYLQTKVCCSFGSSFHFGRSFALAEPPPHFLSGSFFTVAP